MKIVRKALEAAGIDSLQYSDHSFRSGTAITTAKQGIGNATIMMTMEKYHLPVICKDPERAVSSLLTSTSQ